MERLQHALVEIQAALAEHKKQAEDAQRREAELAVQLEAERSAHSQREGALLDANARLLARVDELSMTVTKLQTQVVELTRSANQQIVRSALPSNHASPRLIPSTPSNSLPPAGHLISTLSPINNSVTLTNLPKSPAAIDGGGLLAAIDRSLDHMKLSAAEDLEKYTDRLKQRTTTNKKPAVQPLNNVSTVSANLDSKMMVLTPTPQHTEERDASHPSRPQPEGRPPAARSEHPTPATTSRRTDAESARLKAESTKTGPSTATKASPPAAKLNVSSSRVLAQTSSASAKQHASATSVSSKTTKHIPAVGNSGYAARAATKGGSYTITLAADTHTTAARQVPPVSHTPSTQQHTQTQTTQPRTDAAHATEATQIAMGTPARPEVRAAPYDDYRIEAKKIRTSVGSAAVHEHTYVDEESASEDERASPARHIGSDPVSPARAATVGVKAMSAPEFFSLLRAHVPPTGLQKLMSALASHQQGALTRANLMENASTFLKPSREELDAAGLPPADIDLVAAFDAYLHK